MVAVAEHPQSLTGKALRVQEKEQGSHGHWGCRWSKEMANQKK